MAHQLLADVCDGGGEDALGGCGGHGGAASDEADEDAGVGGVPVREPIVGWGGEG